MKLIDLAKTHKTDKLSHGYLKVYDSIFAKIQDRRINFLEIGVYQGQSASLWSAYFNNAEIFMSDIFDKSNMLSKFNIHFFKGDSGGQKYADNLMSFAQEKTGKDFFDVIIDDGSHFQYDQMNGIGNLFPHLSPGGYYIIEDICKEERLKNGSMWWGHSSEPHHSTPGPCHAGSQLRSDEEWLAGDKIDFSACTDATIKSFLNTNIFSSKFLTDGQNEYITKNTDTIDYYSEENILNCSSKLAVFKKKK